MFYNINVSQLYLNKIYALISIVIVIYYRTYNFIIYNYV